MSDVRQDKAALVLFDKKESGGTYGAGIADGESGSWTTLYNGEQAHPKLMAFPGDPVGRGHEWNGTTRDHGAWDFELGLSLTATERMAAWIAAFGLGSVSSASSGEGYRHTIKPLLTTSSNQPPSTSIFQCQSDESSKMEAHGICVDTFGFNGDLGPNNNVMANVTLVGSGKVDTSTAISVPAVAERPPFRCTSISVATIGASSARDIASRLRGFGFTHGNALQRDKGYRANTTLVNDGAVRQALQYGDRRETGRLTLKVLALRGSQPELTDYLAGTSQSVIVTCKGRLLSGASATYAELKFRIPNCYLDENQPAWDGVSKTFDLVLVPHYDSGLSAPYSIEVVNSVSGYLANAA